MSVCTEEERQAGRPYPRTCPTCKFGGCQRGHYKGTKPPATPPASDEVDRLIERLQKLGRDMNRHAAPDWDEHEDVFAAVNTITELRNKLEAAEHKARGNKLAAEAQSMLRADAESELTTARAQAADLRAILRRIAEGNLGDDPWQANYDRIREVARAALTSKPKGAK